MSARYFCESSDRRAQLIENGFLAADGVSPINAIDFLEVVDGVLDDQVVPSDDPRQHLLLIRFLQPLTAGALDKNNISIRGGTTVRDLHALGAFRLSELPPLPGPFSPIAHAYLDGRRTSFGPAESDAWLVVLTDQRGDHSPYQFKLVDGVASNLAPPSFDPILTEVAFNFKIECPSDFDCEDTVPCEDNDPATPVLDYLARDYRSFRRLILDRLTVLMPDWQERSPVDLGITLVELLAYSADRAAYFQDAVATEGYLDTARLRTSVRRHARLLDYAMHEGCNARTWVHLTLAAGATGTLEAGARFLTQLPNTPAVIPLSEETTALELTPEVFETLEAPILHHSHNEIHIHTWGEKSCVLSTGSTSAALHSAPGAADLALSAGEVIVFEEVRHPESGAASDADLSRRHAVRLTSVSAVNEDLLLGVRYWEVTWHTDDALPFPFCLHDVAVETDPIPVTVARGNIVLVDHGQTRSSEMLEPSEVPLEGRYRPYLSRPNVTWSVPYVAGLSAKASLMQDPHAALPAVTLQEAELTWSAARELLGTDPFTRNFVVEMEDEGRAYLRFGDGVLGREASRGANLTPTFRTGRGVDGNVGSGAIQHAVSDALFDTLEGVRNPLPATGGIAPERIETVKLEAPQAFRTQMRAVTAEDWAEVAARHPAVQRAVATLRFTGSWNTVYLTVDPVGGRSLDQGLQEELRAFLEEFRLAGIDLELRPPAYAPIDLRLAVCVSADRFKHEVKAEVLDRLSSGMTKRGELGFFHPDRLTFGEDVLLSPIVAEIMNVPGVSWVDFDAARNGSDTVRFRRYGHTDAGELEAGVLKVSRLEVARLDNNPSAPDYGLLRLTMRGGR